MGSTATILGDSPQTRALRRYLPKVARSEITVLITGETGTGKERVAEALHAMSPRGQGRFVTVNCAALPESLIESELFGHQRGAFTGACNTYADKAAEADGGTLFLDEIGEMSLYAQAKLVRLLEARTVDRVGTARPIPVNVRVIAATNQALAENVREGLFRADLYYRLNVARIELTPLRERPGDIITLVKAFLSGPLWR